jgi:hypothetical protein
VPRGGDLVPDTCRSADLEVPVRGRGTLQLRLPAAAPVPETLVAVHPKATIRRDRRPPVTTLRRERVERDAEGVRVVYAGPFRTDVGDATRVDVAGPDGTTRARWVRLEPVEAAAAPPPAPARLPGDGASGSR